MKSTKFFFKILLLCCSILFLKKNATAQCSGFNVTATQTADGSSKGDATVTATVSGSSGSVLYYWINSSNNIVGYGSSSVKNSLNAGTYCVIAIDSSSSTFCKDTFCLTVTDTGSYNCTLFQPIINEIDSCSYNDISLYTWVYGGSGKYSYLWNTGDTSNNLFNKTSGSYSVIITDNIYGCKDTLYKTVVDDTCNLCVSFKNGGYITKYKDSCQINDITLFAYQWGGSYSYSYLWNTGDTSSSLNNRTSGSYSVIITDKVYGCKDTLYLSVSDDTCSPCQNFQGWITKIDSCGLNDVILKAYPRDSLGSNSYLYLWNTGTTMNVLTNKSTGFYWVKITDTNTGCTDTAYISVSDDTCNPCQNYGGYMYKYDSCMSNDLKIYAYAYGGSGNYNYAWNTGATTSFLSNKPTGWYKVTITDNTYGCVYKDSIYVVDSNFKCCKAWFYTYDSAVASTKTFYGYSNVYDSTGGSTTTFTWDFGDGNTGTGQTKNHTYTSSGNKTVCLYINTISGCKDTFCSVVSSPPPGKNLKITHYGIPYIKDANRYTYLTYQNIGTTTENGIVEYKYPAGMTLVSSSITPLSHIGNKITFNVGSLSPGASGVIYLLMHTPTSYTLGTIKCDTAIILPISGDIQTFNNTSYECDSVVTSWDPNDKTPYPKGIGTEGAISPDTKEIGYLVRFENEGNWRTYRVRVEDEIDLAFDINSLMLGDASHEFRLVKNNRKLTWYFDDIELTPKSVDPNRSHGYIQYTLKLNEGLPVGTQIKNTAYIYFDGNPAIITNTTKNTLKSADGSAAIGNIDQSDLDFSLEQNKNDIFIHSDRVMESVSIYDLSGKTLYSELLKGKEVIIPQVIKASGIYIIHVEIDGNTVIKKFKF